VLELKNISFSTNERNILDNLNFTFESGLSYAILGNNGVGKSSLAKIIMGTDDYRTNHTGKIYFNDEDITEKNISERAKLGITMTWQEPVRFQGITVKDYISLGGKININNSEIFRLLDIAGLNHSYINRKVDKTLSGGERKRIELISIIALKPKFVIFDEPDSGIDMMSNSMIKSIIQELLNIKATVLSITHREEIAMISNKAILLCAGKINMVGDPEKVSNTYKSLCDNCSHVNNPVKDLIEVKL